MNNIYIFASNLGIATGYTFKVVGGVFYAIKTTASGVSILLKWTGKTFEVIGVTADYVSTGTDSLGNFLVDGCSARQSVINARIAQRLIEEAQMHIPEQTLEEEIDEFFLVPSDDLSEYEPELDKLMEEFEHLKLKTD